MELRLFRRVALLTTAFIGCVLMLTLLTPLSTAGQLTSQARRGKQIYLKGHSPAGSAITALVGKGLVEAPGTTLPCVNCHGYDGLGRPESGIIPSNITWGYLTTSYGLQHRGGRTHPAYDEETVAKAIVDGVDPAGNRLDAAMPRYVLSKADLADLIAYLKSLETDRGAGVTGTRIKVGTVLPMTGALADMGREMKAIMTAYFQDINAGGGIYHRQIELHVADYSDTPTATVTNVKQLIERQQVFALMGAFTANVEKEIAELAETEEIPLVGPLTLFPQDDVSFRRFTFYLLAGVREQLRVLVHYAARTLRLQKPRVAILYPADAKSAEIADAIEQQGKKFGWSSGVRREYVPGRFEALPLATNLHKGGTDVLFFLGSGAELTALIREAERMGWTPYIFLSGSLITRDIFDAPFQLAQRIFLTYPVLPSDRTDAGTKELMELYDRHQLSARHQVAQLSAYCAAKILVEGIKRAGKDLSRDKLITALEGLYEFDTGLTPRITYGRNRRLGAMGAYIVTIDLQNKRFVPVSGWIMPD